MITWKGGVERREKEERSQEGQGEHTHTHEQANVLTNVMSESLEVDSQTFMTSYNISFFFSLSLFLFCQDKMQLLTQPYLFLYILIFFSLSRDDPHFTLTQSSIFFFRRTSTYTHTSTHTHTFSFRGISKLLFISAEDYSVIVHSRLFSS